MDLKLNNSWQKFIDEESKKNYFVDLISFIDEVYENNNESVFPAKNELLKAFTMCPIEDLKVVILGQAAAVVFPDACIRIGSTKNIRGGAGHRTKKVHCVFLLVSQ